MADGTAAYGVSKVAKIKYHMPKKHSWKLQNIINKIKQWNISRTN